MSISANIKSSLRGDRVIWAIVGILAIISVLVIYSSTGTLAYRQRGGNTSFYLVKQLIVLGFGFLMTYICYLLHYTKYSRLAPILLAISVPLLLYTLFFGADINSAKRWISVPGLAMTFQTSDFAKLALIIYIARVISSKQEKIKGFRSAFLPIILPIVTICFLIAPADLSTAAVLFVTCFIMMFIGRVDTKYIASLLLIGVFTFGIMVLIGYAYPNSVRVETWTTRIKDFTTNSEGSYQNQQGKIAIANGGFFGKGPGNSTQRNYLPSPYADFIFAIICEEYGLFGGAIMLGLYVLLFFRTATLVTKSPKTFGAILAIGLSLILVIQALANMAVSVGLVPVMGLPLPMVSMGGTSSLFACIAFGIILSVSKYIEQTKIENN